MGGLAFWAGWTVRQDNGHSFATGGAGWGVLTSDVEVAVFVNEFAPDTGADGSSYSSIQMPAGGGTTLYAPTIVKNAYGGYTTGIGLANTGSLSTIATVTYRDAAGTTITGQTVTLPPHANTGLYSGDPALALPNGFVGSATITSSSQVLAAIVNETGPGGQFSSYDAIASGAGTLFAPAALHSSAGVATTKTFPIAANGSLGVYQGSLTDGPAPGAYTAKITSTVAVAAIVNEFAPSTSTVKQSTSYNTFVGGASTLHLPLVENAGPDGWSTGEGIMNTGTSPTTVTVTYYDIATGATVGTPQAMTLQPNAFWGLSQTAGGLPIGTRTSAVVTTSTGGQVAVICNETSATTFMSYGGQ